MKFLVDNQLPPALVRFIQQDLGVEAIHVRDIQLDGASDEDLWRFASQNSWIVRSKDEDFVRIFLKSPVAKLLWARFRNCRRVELLSAFRKTWPRLIGRFRDGERFVEIR